MEVSQAVLEARRRLKERMGSGVVQVGGKGSMRRKTKYKPVDSRTNNNDKLDLILKKVGVSDFGDVEEIYIFFNNSSYLEFRRPKFLGSVKHCTFIVTGESISRSVDMSSVFKGFRSPNPDSMPLNSDILEKIRDRGLHVQLDDYRNSIMGEKRKNSRRKSSNKRNSDSSDSSDSCNEGVSMFKKVRPDDEKRLENKDRRKGGHMNKGGLTNGSGKEKERSMGKEYGNDKREDNFNTQSADEDDVISDFIPEAVDDFEAFAKE